MIFLISFSSKVYTSYLQAIELVRSREGFRGLYRGLFPAIILYAPVASLTFGSYELFNRAWNRLPLRKFGRLRHTSRNNRHSFFFLSCLDSIKHAFNGGAAGLLAKLTVYPFDLTKKRLEVVNFDEARSKFGQV